MSTHDERDTDGAGAEAGPGAGGGADAGGEATSPAASESQSEPGFEVELYPDGWPIDTRALYPLALERYGEAYLAQAGRVSMRNEQRILQSDTCFCYYCGYRFDPRVVSPGFMRGPSGETTGLCPLCQLDMLLCSADGYPITDPVFIAGMAEYSFNGYCPIADGKPIKPIHYITIEVE